MHGDNVEESNAFNEVAGQLTKALEMAYIEEKCICNFWRRSSDRLPDRTFTSWKLFVNYLM